MAKSVMKVEHMQIDPEVKQEQEKEELLDALLDNKQTALSVITLMQKLDDRGVLDLLIGLFGQGDKVLAIAAKEMNKPGVSDALQNILKFGQIAGQLNVDKMTDLVENVNAGLDEAQRRVDNGEKTSVFGLYKTFRDPDVNRSITALAGFLKGAGRKEGEKKD